MIIAHRSLTAVVVAAFLLAACGGDDGSNGTPVAATTGAATGGSGTEVRTGETDLGTILTDADGNTVYLFESDTKATSTCYEGCASTWPALTTDGEPQAGDGVDASLLGTAARDDGTTQVTYDGHPLYHFSGDQAPGDTNGQEIGDVWYVVAPDGSPVEG